MSSIRTQINRDHFRYSIKDIRADIKKDLTAAVGEFLGTLTFLLIGLGGIQAAATSNAAFTKRTSQNVNEAGSSTTAVPSIEQLSYISLSMGLSLVFSAWIFYRATGAAFNPNVSFALLVIGAIKPVRFVLYVIAQFAGAIVASGLLKALIPGPLTVTPALGAGATKAQGSTFLAPVGIGLTLLAGHLFAVVFTGASMNTARAFGPAVFTGFDSDHWVYWVGPTIGSLLAVIIYLMLKWHKYWLLNEGQDTDEACKSPALFCEEKTPNGLPISRQNRWPSFGQASEHRVGFESPGGRTKFSSFSSQRSPPVPSLYEGTRPV
ncbi:hypothetical protein PTTG_04816 [Puccinia triticina 1-1 BBBD Race 1]|uniref:Aquaporin n=2 Tax=Puccinia triticina TaxID=208348 RepID=A0A0C4EVI1_PUCT1|nr:uncharacterized protein PtA15_14A146 [Puccinia triticina]OAV95686.1 hypothetical protein PTTG_04816 [Puccinia triticina 1-1 BBBD Race 1]WAQ91264.1 hypothetical protein PtA15_14A146 [Puccinia triticina]WAR62068.1 hypothetical protein PtB15_14B162 [Puccinia triticina]